MTTRFASVLVAALGLSLSAGVVSPTHAAPLSAGVEQHKLAQAQGQGQGPARVQIKLDDTQKSQAMQILQGAYNDIINNNGDSFLDNSQKAQVQAAIKGGQNPRQALRSVTNLTPEQKTKIRNRLQAANLKIYNEVLTKDQQQQIQNLRQQRGANGSSGNSR